MGYIAAQDILTLWEIGQQQDPLQRALSMLAMARPDMTAEDLARLDIARRDQMLVRLRQEVMGPRMQVYSECPHCAAGLELGVTTTEILALEAPEPVPPDGIHALEMGELTIRFRLPDSTDLTAIFGHETAEACDLIMERCLIEARRAGKAVKPADLTDEERRALEARMGENSRQADVRLDIACPACGRTYQALFDIVTLLWMEISALAVRLLREVHTLARAYGWSEVDILSMSGLRRRWYLEMVTA